MVPPKSECAAINNRWLVSNITYKLAVAYLTGHKNILLQNFLDYLSSKEQKKKEQTSSQCIIQRNP